MAQAGRPVAGKVRLQGCPRLDAPAHTAQRARLAELAWDMV
ncbi:MAG TPA: hypothetical protein PKO09_02500 [Anaerolineae bacterium]|nr:hypothetical protein [Anaerolineae bacterium]